MHDKIQRYSLRKLSVGLASVMVGACIFGVNGKTVKADVTSDQTTQTTNVQGQTATTQPQNEKQQTSSDQNSVADQSQKNLLDDLGKQKTSTQSGDQAEAQENRLVDQINYKLTNNTSTDNNQDLGQNKVAPDETKSTSTTKSDAEKSIVGSSSTQQVNNQSNDHAEDNSQTQLDITKNSQQLNKKVLATNLTQDNLTQKDYTPDIGAWTGHDDGTYYILDKYTPQNDAEKDLIVIPNEADFEKAGKSINGHEVGITSKTVGDFMHQINPKEVHFSETNAKKIKAVDTDWRGAFSPVLLSNFKLTSHLQAITGNSFDTSNIKIMTEILSRSHELTDISALSTWNVSNVSGHLCFSGALGDDTKLTNLTPLTNWDVSNASDMGNMFDSDISLTDISPLNKWNTKNVLYFDNIFRNCQNLVNADAINNWDFSSVSTDPSFGNLRGFFDGDHKLMIHINKDSNLDDYTRKTNHLNAFYNSGTIVTDNTKLIKLLTNNDLQNETATAKRTITFSGLPANKAISPIVQLIHYTKLVNATIDMSQTGDNNKQGVLNNPYYGNTFQLDASKQNDDVIIDGVVYFKPVKIPHVNGYKAHLIKDPVNPTAFLVSFMAMPEQPQNNQSNNVQSPQKPAQAEQNQPEPIQTKPADNKQVDQLVRTISYALMHNSSSNADSFEPAQNDSDQLEAPSDSTQKDDAAKPQKVNAAKHKKHIVKKRVVKRHKKHAKKYHLKRRSRKHSKRSKKRIIKHRKSVSRKFRKHNLKHVKKN